MDPSLVLQSFREIDEEFESGGSEYIAQTHALGRTHSFYFVMGFDDNSRVLAIGDAKATLQEAFERGRIVDLTEGYQPNDAYDRTILIERALRNGVPLEEAIGMTEGKPDYKTIDRKLGEPAGGHVSLAVGAPPQPF